MDEIFDDTPVYPEGAEVCHHAGLRVFLLDELTQNRTRALLPTPLPTSHKLKADLQRGQLRLNLFQAVQAEV